MILGAESNTVPMTSMTSTSQLPALPAPTTQQKQTKTMLELLVFMLRGSDGLDLQPKYRDVLTKIYTSAVERATAGKYPVLTYWELQTIFAIARSKGAVALKGADAPCFGCGGQLGAAGNSTVRAIQTALKKLGLDVRVTGTLDARTVAGINAIFGGWDDAPVKLRSGSLTSRQVAASLPAVKRYLTLAIGGAQKMLNADQGD